MLSEDLSILEDTTPEFFSTLDALDDISDAVETIVLGLAGERERNAFLALAEECESYAETVPEQPAQRTQEQNARLLEFQKLMDDAFAAMLGACPDHIRTLRGAVRAAVEAEEAATM